MFLRRFRVLLQFGCVFCDPAAVHRYHCHFVCVQREDHKTAAGNKTNETKRQKPDSCAVPCPHLDTVHCDENATASLRNSEWCYLNGPSYLSLSQRSGNELQLLEFTYNDCPYSSFSRGPPGLLQLLCISLPKQEVTLEAMNKWSNN